MKCGSVCLTQFPFTDGTSAKVRPVLVVSKDEFNTGDDVVVVPISSKPLQDDQYSVFIDSSSPCFPATGLQISSVVKYTKLGGQPEAAPSTLSWGLAALDPSHPKHRVARRTCQSPCLAVVDEESAGPYN